MTRARLLDEADGEELTGWLAYHRIKEPSAEEHLLATICALICQATGSKKAKPADFLPRRRTAARKKSADEIRAPFMALVAAMGPRGGQDGQCIGIRP